MKSAQELMQSLTKGDKIRFNHDQRGKLLPYFTREPERAKFLNGFHPVVGSLVRRSLDLSMPAEFDDGIVDRERLSANVNFNGMSIERFMQVFSDVAIERVHLPRLLAYVPLSDGNEAKGDIAVADYLYQLYGFDNNATWSAFLKNESATNPYERLILSNAKQLDVLKDKKSQFQFMQVNELRSKFTNDLANMLSSRQFFDEHIDTFLSFYYFTYSVKLIASLERTDHSGSQFKPYYALESERLSQSRRAAGSHSFRSLRMSAKNLLVETDILDYINILLDRDYMFMPEIMALNGPERNDLEYELRVFITQFNYGMPENNIKSLEVETADLGELISGW
ncbi:DNA phosphorothioation-dependent restriction protein DptG [Lacticaseibacillus songhuajiangensis]|uniref:DNA phosphorothioation-dependent restriction protein DptG n=1 Tax=Lacticaseibacillus songhuajiangensis TaxID=1296539 RepID=UPI000F771CA8|nr:DNA phosphorothioation-dependent restriction protein DptG [Lacticaseibacillus songhuajiangensis]